LPLINDSQEKEKKKFKGYKEAAGKTFIKKEGKKKNYLVPFQIASKIEKKVVVLGSFWNDFTKGN